MKKFRIRILSSLLLCCLMMAQLVSCDEIDLDFLLDDEPTLEDLNPQVESSYSIPIYKMFEELLEDVSGGNDPESEGLAQWIRNSMDALYKQAEEIAQADAASQDDGGNSLFPAIEAILENVLLEARVLSYNTLGADGRKISSSMLVAWPWRPFPKVNPHPDHIVLGCHATVTSDKERPSNYENLDVATDVRIIVGQWASSNIVLGLITAIYDIIKDPVMCLVVMPDYEGYGSTRNKPHPYLNREVQARQCVDAAQAAYLWYEENEKSMQDGFKTVSLGYSQGGAIAAASYRYWLEHKTRYKSLNFSGAVCGDGPYDPYATLQFYVKRNEMEMPCAPALVIKGMMDSDREMKQAGGKLEDYLTEGFIKTGIFEGIAAKDKGTGTLDDMVVNYAKAHPDELKLNSKNHVLAESVLLPDVFAFFKDGTLPADPDRAAKIQLLKHCLRKNALNYKSDTQDWTPPAGARFTFFHSPLDGVVPEANLNSVKDSWGKSSPACRYVKYGADIDSHSSIGTQFMLVDMPGEVYLLLEDDWKSNSVTITDVQWTP